MSDAAPRDMAPARGAGRALIVALIVLALLVVAADVGLRLWTQAWLSRRIEQGLELPRRPVVELGGVPFLTQFLRGRLDEADITLEQVRAEGLVLDRAEIHLEGVGFSQADLLAGRGGPVDVERGTVRAVVQEAALNEFLAEQEIPLTVELAGRRVRVTATVEVRDEEVTATARGRPAIEEGSLVFRPERVRVADAVEVPIEAVAFEVPVPPVVPGTQYERVRVEDGRAIVHASLDGVRVELDDA